MSWSSISIVFSLDLALLLSAAPPGDEDEPPVPNTTSNMSVVSSRKETRSERHVDADPTLTRVPELYPPDWEPPFFEYRDSREYVDSPDTFLRSGVGTMDAARVKGITLSHTGLRGIFSSHSRERRRFSDSMNFSAVSVCLLLDFFQENIFSQNEGSPLLSAISSSSPSKRIRLYSLQLRNEDRGWAESSFTESKFRGFIEFNEPGDFDFNICFGTYENLFAYGSAPDFRNSFAGFGEDFFML